MCVKARETSFVKDKILCQNSKFQNFAWGDGAVYQPWTLPPLFSATTMIIDTNGTAYESRWIGLSDTSNIVAKLVLVAE